MFLTRLLKCLPCGACGTALPGFCGCRIIASLVCVRNWKFLYAKVLPYGVLTCFRCRPLQGWRAGGQEATGTRNWNPQQKQLQSTLATTVIKLCKLGSQKICNRNRAHRRQHRRQVQACCLIASRVPSAPSPQAPRGRRRAWPVGSCDSRTFAHSCLFDRLSKKGFRLVQKDNALVQWHIPITTVTIA